MKITLNIVPLSFLFTLLVGCSHSVEFDFIGEETSMKLHGSNFADLGNSIAEEAISFENSLASKNELYVNGFQVLYFSNNGRAVKLITDKNMNQLSYEIVPCKYPEVDVDFGEAYRLKQAPLNIEQQIGYDYFAVVLPLELPYDRKNRVITDTSWDIDKLKTSEKCIRFSSGKMGSAYFVSNLVEVGVR